METLGELQMDLNNTRMKENGLFFRNFNVLDDDYEFLEKNQSIIEDDNYYSQYQVLNFDFSKQKDKNSDFTK